MKAVKYILLGLAPLVLIVGLWLYMSGDDGVRIPNRVTLFDVVTGEIVTKHRTEVIAIPWKNDRDGKFTLYPVSKNEAGKWIVDGRMRDALRELAKSETVKVDLDSLTAQVD